MTGAPSVIDARLPRDLEAFSRFLMSRLYRSFSLRRGQQLSAITETEKPTEGDTWFWTDDNCKALQLLSCPNIWRLWPDDTAKIFRFVQGMCDGPFIFRRLSLPRMEMIHSDGGGGKFIHSLMDIGFDGQRGILNLGIRFHDGRTGQHISLTGNFVEFTFGGRCHVLDVEDAIDTSTINHEGEKLVLSHSGNLKFRHNFRLIRLGRITYTYTIHARSMLINVEAALALDGSIEVSDVVLTVGHDNLSHGNNNVHYSKMFCRSAEQDGQSFTAGEVGEKRIRAEAASYYAITQSEISGFALGIHSMPRVPRQVEALSLVVQRPGHFHWIAARYAFPGRHRAGQLIAAEDKVLTAGGFYNRPADYERIMRAHRAAEEMPLMAVDLSISYDYGVEIDTFAKCFAALSEHPELGGDDLTPEGTRNLFDQYLAIYLENFVEKDNDGKSSLFVRQLAFVIMGASTMLRTTGDQKYRNHLINLCDALFAFERLYEGITGQKESGFVMGGGTDQSVYVDCHSAALLALALAGRHLDDPRLYDVIDRGLSIYMLETTSVLFAAEPHKIDVVALSWIDANGTRRSNNSFWNYQAGLTLRLFNALKKSPNRKLQEIYRRHRERIEVFEAIMLRQIMRSTHYHDDGGEVRCSTLSTETNSETQPWVLLGLFGHPYD